MSEHGPMFRVLGPLWVSPHVGLGDITGRREARILGALLLSANAPVALADLVDLVWGATPPATARQQVQNCVSALERRWRRVGLRPVRRVPSGYLLELSEDALDASRFLADAERGRRALAGDDPEGASVALRRALGHWRGDVLGGVSLGPFEPIAVHLTDRRLIVLEDYFDSQLRANRHREVVAEIQAAARQHPLRERLIGLLMRALAATGRTAEALEVYRRTQARLADAYGMDTGPDLHGLFLSILRQDTSVRAAPPSLDVEDIRGDLERALACATWAKTTLERLLDRVEARPRLGEPSAGRLDAAA